MRRRAAIGGGPAQASAARPIGGLIGGAAPVGDDGPVSGLGPGARGRAGDQLGHHGQMRLGQVPVAQPVVHVGQLVLDRLLPAWLTGTVSSLISNVRV